MDDNTQIEPVLTQNIDPVTQGVLNDLMDITPGTQQGDIIIIGSNNKYKRFAPGTAGYYLKTNGPAADPSWDVPAQPVSLNLFGTGVDGAVTISADTTLTRDMFYTTLVVNNGITLNTGGFKVYASVSITNNGTITRAGNNGGDGVQGGDASGDTDGAAGDGGSAGAALSSGTLFGTVAGLAGANGGGATSNGADANGGNATASSMLPSNGAVGGRGGGGALFVTSPARNGDAGLAGAAGTTTQISKALSLDLAFQPYYGAGQLQTSGSGSSGSGGGGGGYGSDSLNARGGGGGGGGSGSPGGVIALFSPIITNAGTLTVKGGNGGAGGRGGNASGGTHGSYGGGGGGGGAPGNGGVIILVCKTWTNTGTVNISPGSIGIGGNAGSGSTTSGVTGNNAATGSDGALYLHQLTY